MNPTHETTLPRRRRLDAHQIAAMLLGVPIIARAGAMTRRHSAFVRRAERAARAVIAMVKRDRGVRAVLLGGPSGGGKSTVLGAMCARLASTPRTDVVIRVDTLIAALRGCKRLVAELGSRRGGADARGTVIAWLRTLAFAGLGEPALLATAVNRLSVGQRQRLAIAVAMADAESQRCVRGVAGDPEMQRVWLVCDEFASPLDRASAMSMCVTLRRWLDARCDVTPRVVLIAATARCEAVLLCPDVAVECGLDGVPRVSRRWPNAQRHRRAA